MNKKRVCQTARLFTLFTICAFLFPARAAAQEVKLTIRLTDVTMERVMKQIEEQSDYLFLSNKDVDLATIVTVDAQRQPLSEVLTQMLRGTDYTYRIDGTHILLSKSNRNPVTVRGVVRDASGVPIIGASVVVRGTRIGVATNPDGSFLLQVPYPASEAVLVVTYLGYEPAEVTVDGKTDFQITLLDTAVSMENVVVTALGIRRQEKALSYNIQQIAADEFTTVKETNFMNSLAGKVAGVSIKSGTGGPGSSVRVVMRGEKSIENNNNALYVIDGVPMYNRNFGGTGGVYQGAISSESIADINPEDIESVNVLTGPSAAALYGSEAAHGVVLINTRRGVADHTLVTVSNTTTFSRVYQMPAMQNTYGTSSGLMNWGDPYNSPFDARGFFNTGTELINSVSLSTGNQRNQTYVSASSTNATGIVPENSYDRYNFGARNTTTFAKEKMTLNIGANFILQHDLNMISQGKYNNPLPALYLFPRSEDFDEIRLFERWSPVLGLMEQYWPYGEGAHSLQNPYWIQNRMIRETIKQRYMFNVSLRWDVLDWLNVTGRLNVDNSQYRLLEKRYATTLATFCDENGGYKDETQSDRSFYGDVIVNMDKSFDEGMWTLNANVGASINDHRFAQAGGGGNLYLIPNLFSMNNINYTNKYQPRHSGYVEQSQSIFASAEAGYKSMLYLTLTGRNDWDSRLAFSDKSSFFYWSTGLSALVSNMTTLPRWMPLLKVRGSYSSVGRSFNRFYSNPPNTFDAQSHGWTAAVTYPARNLKPEYTKSWELGLNARFLDGKFDLDATFYRSNTYNQTLYAPLPASSGYSNIIVQAGNVQNQGVELALSYHNKWHGFNWSSTYTYTYNNNKILRLASGTTNPYTGEPIIDYEIQQTWLGQSNVAPLLLLREGGSMSDIYVNHELARDLNGQIEIDPSTGNLSMVETEFRKVGSLAPRFLMGWNNNFSYRGVDLGFVLAARVGGLVYSATQGVLDFYGTSQASADARDRGGVAVNYGKVDAQKYYSAISTAEGGHGAYYLYSATNVRLQELSLRYTLPASWIGERIKLTVGFVGRNLWMLYCKAPFDPDLSPATGSNYYQGVDYFMMPSTRNLGFNVKMTF